MFRFLEPSQSLDEGPVHPFKDAEAQLPSVLVEEFFSITLLIGRIGNLPANVQSAFTIQHQGKVQQNTFVLVFHFRSVSKYVLGNKANIKLLFNLLRIFIAGKYCTFKGNSCTIQNKVKIINVFH